MRLYTQQHPFYCGIAVHARTMDVCILPQAGAILVPRACRRAQRHFCRRSPPLGRIASSPSRAFFRGTGSLICGPTQDCLVSSGMPCLGQPSMAAKRHTTGWTPGTSPYSSAVACSRRPLSPRQRGGRLVRSSGAACL